MSAQHTPGPWATEQTTLAICRGIVSIEDVNAIEVHPVADESHAIAYVPNDCAVKTAAANARLIAAAPDLLEAARALDNLIDQWGKPGQEGRILSARCLAKEAISKAEAIQ